MHVLGKFTNRRGTSNNQKKSRGDAFLNIGTHIHEYILYLINVPTYKHFSF